MTFGSKGGCFELQKRGYSQYIRPICCILLAYVQLAYNIMIKTGRGNMEKVWFEIK